MSNNKPPPESVILHRTGPTRCIVLIGTEFPRRYGYATLHSDPPGPALWKAFADITGTLAAEAESIRDLKKALEESPDARAALQYRPPPPPEPAPPDVRMALVTLLSGPRSTYDSRCAAFISDAQARTPISAIQRWYESLVFYRALANRLEPIRADVADSVEFDLTRIAAHLTTLTQSTTDRIMDDASPPWRSRSSDPFDLLAADLATCAAVRSIKIATEALEIIAAYRRSRTAANGTTSTSRPTEQALVTTAKE